MEQSITLSFCGGTGTTTGANFLLEISKPRNPRPDSESHSTLGARSLGLDSVASKKILVDCGLEQGSEFADVSNREDFPYDPANIEVLLVTHAHADHIGRIPKLIKDGFKGKIYSTAATYDLAKVMLPDTLGLLEEDARNKGVLPLYEKHDMEKAFELWESLQYYSQTDLGDGVSVYAKDAGHILGSAIYEISIGKPANKIVFTGDLGNSPALLLRDTDEITDAKYMVMESVYGDRNHEPKDDRRRGLLETIKDTIQCKKTLIIPAFSLERTQNILFEINNMLEKGEIEEVKVYLDSPLAAKVTEVYRKHSREFNETAKGMIAGGDDLFDFPKLKTVMQRSDSERIDNTAGPKIIIGGSGMSNGGRIIRHEKYFLPDSNTILLLVGYQSMGTLGRRILDGAKEVHIDGEKIKVRAEIRTVLGYSSHKDSDHLIDFVSKSADKLKKVFVTMGEPKSALFLTQRLRDYIGVDAMAPKKGDKVMLEF